MEKYKQDIKYFITLYKFSDSPLEINENIQQTQNQHDVIEVIPSYGTPFELQQGQGQGKILLHGAEEEIFSTSIISPPGLNLFEVQVNTQHQNGEAEAHNMSIEFNHAQQVQSQDSIYLNEVEEDHNYVNFSFPPGPNTQQVQSQNRIYLDEAEKEHNVNFSFPPGPNTQQSQNIIYLDEAEEHNVNLSFPPGPNTQQVQSQNIIYLDEAEEQHNVNLSFPPGPNAPFDHQQNQILQSLQSLPSQNQFFQSGPALREDQNDAQSIADFLNDNGVQEVICENVVQLIKRYKGPKLFTKIRGSSTFCTKDYKKCKRKCEWKLKGLELSFLSLLERHKKVVKKLTTNRGYVKRGLWEYVSYILSQNGYKDMSPLQCARKWKNIKRDYKKNKSEYKYKLNVDRILGNNWYQME